MTAAELADLGAELGLDAIGAAPAAPYEETERHIRERKARGLFATMGFTTRRPEVSCHPESLLDGARTVVSAALCYYADAPEAGPGEGRLARYTWSDRYAELRERLDALGRRLGGSYRVLVDDNEHVDREAAVRAGVAFYGKSTLAITRRHGSWVVLGTLVTDQEIEPSQPLANHLNGSGCGSCTLCIEACPTDALAEAGTLDSTRCLSYWTQAPAPIPEEYRERLGPLVYGCDVCQDVCPWNQRFASALPENSPYAARAALANKDAPTLAHELLEMSAEDYARAFAGSPMKRAKLSGLRRNAAVVVGNVRPDRTGSTGN
jgi:epoxyqueuosine reductase